MFYSCYRRYVTVFCALLLLILNSLSFHLHNEKILHHELVTKTIRVQDDHIHDVIFCIKKDIDLLDKELMDRSTPGSPKYQQWLSNNEINELLNTTESYNHLMEYLNDYKEIEIKNVTGNYEIIVASAPITTWESMFNTEFYHWHDMRTDNKKIHVLAEAYTIPIEIVDYVQFVLNTVQLPPIISHNKGFKIPIETYESMKANNKTKLGKQQPHLLATPSSPPPPPPTYTTIPFLRDYLYRIDSFQGSSSLSQAVFQTNDEQWSQSDLTKFQRQFGITEQNAIDVGNRQTSNCQANDNPQGVSCNEGNLDIQYLMGIAQNTASYVWWIDKDAHDDAFLQFLLDVYAIANPPSVLSISWGSNELNYPTSYVTMFNSKAAELGVRGISIFVSSGDDGVFGFDYTKQLKCNCNFYNPSFPATSPYVTAVGATMGPNDWTTEVACQSDRGGVITSGGGFSNYKFNQYKDRPPWQETAVNSYLSSGQTAVSGYGSGRGIPDVSAIGTQFVVFLYGSPYLMFGTSASAPLFAGMISLINAKRLASGLGTVGFLNPTLYSNSDKFNDITSGDNKCCAKGCCPSPRKGFTATSGWDPVTGLGSIQFSMLKMLFTQTEAPTVSPTFKPTPITRFPTKSPTLRPTVQEKSPTMEPTTGTDIMFDNTISISSNSDISPLLSSSDTNCNVYCKSIKETIAEILDISTDNVFLVSISSNRRLSIAVMSFVFGVTINFRIKTSSAFSNAYDTAISKLESSFESGDFSSTLSFNSFINGATGLITATVTSLIVGENLLVPTFSPTPGPTDFYQNYYFYIVVAVGGFALILIALGLLYYYRTRKVLYVYGLPADFNLDDLKLILVGIKSVRKFQTKVLVTFESNRVATFNYKNCRYHDIFYFIHKIKLEWASFIWFEKYKSSLMYRSSQQGQGTNAVRTRQQMYLNRESDTEARNVPIAIALVEPQHQTSRGNTQGRNVSSTATLSRFDEIQRSISIEDSARSTSTEIFSPDARVLPSAPSIDLNNHTSSSESEKEREV